MKELSIEQKAKAYDKAIERAKQHCADYVVETIFPELKESEDERIRRALIDCLQYMKVNYCIPSRYTSKQYDTWIAWLEKQGKQKSAWSEEDEVGLGDAMWAIEQARTIAKDENDMGNLWCAERWLKSIKDRYTWKPSDEQMNALNYVVNLMASSERPTENDLYYNILKSLRQQLKKLMEDKLKDK